MKKPFDPFDETTWPTEKEAMRARITDAVLIAASEIKTASDGRLAKLLEIGIDPTHRADCRASYDYAKAYFAQYFEIGQAICAATVLHDTGAKQRIMLGTLASQL